MNGDEPCTHKSQSCETAMLTVQLLSLPSIYQP